MENTMFASYKQYFIDLLFYGNGKKALTDQRFLQFFSIDVFA